MLVLFVNDEEIDWEMDFDTRLSFGFTPTHYGLGKDAMVRVEGAWFPLDPPAHAWAAMFS